MYCVRYVCGENTGIIQIPGQILTHDSFAVLERSENVQKKRHKDHVEDLDACSSKQQKTQAGPTARATDTDRANKDQADGNLDGNKTDGELTTVRVFPCVQQLIVQHDVYR